MLAANYSEFREDLKKFLDKVEFNNETLVIKGLGFHNRGQFFYLYSDFC